jgi:hypothetical protein
MQISSDARIKAADIGRTSLGAKPDPGWDAAFSIPNRDGVGRPRRSRRISCAGE